ncbi:MAG TPA: TonB-dependent receptor [Bacteroidales bacterium]|nr:TonB-dependent receptor [Bacteroidales bacterium]
MIDQELNIKNDTSFSNTTLHVNEAFIYFEDEIKPLPKLFIASGLRASGFISAKKLNLNIEPRFSANYEIFPKLVIKGGYSRMVQYIHLLTSSGLSLPTDIWIPSLNGIEPLKSDQINFGLSFNLADKALVSIEGYQKWLYNTTDYRNGASLLLDFSPWYQKTIQGKGLTKGIEVSVEKQVGKLTGSLNYTISTASRQYAALNNGYTFPFDYDRLHDFNISVNYKLSKKWDFSALWIFGTGYPVTIQVEKYTPALSVYTVIEHPYIIYYYPSLNNLRLPAYHRLDLGIHYKKEGKIGEHLISIDIFNAYNRKNPVNMYYWLNYSFRYSYLLPLIPSISYTYSFK